MKITDVGHHTIKFLLGTENEQLLIPPYQRRYSWKKKNYEDLIRDISKLDIQQGLLFQTKTILVLLR